MNETPASSSGPVSVSASASAVVMDDKQGILDADCHGDHAIPDWNIATEPE